MFFEKKSFLVVLVNRALTLLIATCECIAEIILSVSTLLQKKIVT